MPLERTATPVELDPVYGALDELSAALGPNGANKDGALSDLRRRRRGQPRRQRRGAQPDADRLLPGGARRWPRTATTCSARWTTCRRSPPRWPPSTPRSASSTTTWPRSPTCWPGSGRTSPRRSPCCPRRWATSPASCRTTPTLLTTNVDRLADVTLALVQQRSALAEVLDVAPAALGNLAHAYNPDYGTLDTRDNSARARRTPRSSSASCWPPAGRREARHDLPVPRRPIRLPTAAADPSSICARLLSGDANADGVPDDLNGNGVARPAGAADRLFGGGGRRRRRRPAARPARVPGG